MTDRRRFTTTLLVSLAVHALLAVVTWHVDIFKPIPPRAEADTMVEVVLIDEPAPAADADDAEPTAYTEIPERLAQERPDQADFLAMQNSRASDRVPGGEDTSPGASRQGEFPQVTVAPENLAGGEGVTVSEPVLVPRQPQASRRQTAQDATRDEETQRGAEATERGEILQPDPREAAGETEARDEEQPRDEPGDYDDWVAEQRAPSLLRQGRQQPAGDRGFDFFQQEQGSIQTNVDLDGDFSLNTYEWNFAPWMRRFVNDLHRSWIPPYAYGLGIIDGFTKIRLAVELDGRVSGMQVLETEGHDSLHTASVAALQAFAPYPPLPPDFPEDRLVIHLQLHYPAWKR